jgi:hypothetical protein
MKDVLRVLGMIVALLLMIGFGMCGLLGVMLGASGGGNDPLDGVMGLGLAGLAIAFGCAWLFGWLLKSGRAPKDKP